MTQEENFKTFVLTQLTDVKSPASGQIYKFQHLEETVEVLINFLSYTIDEESLARIQQNFYSDFQDINDFSKLPSIIEGLATNLEPFLKKIGYLKYKDTSIWDGDTNNKGIKGTMLRRLCNGYLEPKHNHKIKYAIPDPFFPNDKVIEEIIDFVVSNIRNAVHEAKDYKKTELYYYLNLVLGCYLFAIEKSILIIKTIILPEFQYLKKIVEEKSFISLEKIYVDLIGQELEDIDILGYEIWDQIKLLKNIEDYSFEEGEDEEDVYTENIIEEPRVDKIVNIINDINRLEVIAPPGTGKTTTLHKILYNNANKILEGKSGIKFPFYIAANEYKSSRGFKSLLYSSVNERWINNALNKGTMQILIDGLNEIRTELRYDAYREIMELLKDYPNISIIITDRKHGYERRFDLPTYEIKELNDTQILNFIKNYSTKQNADKIWAGLIANKEILTLGRNPLMLKMILSVVKNNYIPFNRGNLYQLFIQTIYIREEQKKRQTNKDEKNIVLCNIAYLMRRSGNISWSTPLFKNYLKNIADENNYKFSVTSFFDELLDNNLIKMGNDEDVSFLHETYQEFFCAQYLNNEFSIYEELDIDLGNTIWHEPLLICQDLYKTAEKKQFFFKYLFRGQKQALSAKPFLSFGSLDLNEDIFIACSVASKHKNKSLDIYEMCETLISNYLSIVKAVYVRENIWIISLETLFSSISVLNSKKLFSKIFQDSDWVEIWLLTEATDLENDKSIRYIDLFTSLSKTILNNVGGIGIILPIIESCAIEYALSKPIFKNLSLLTQNLLLNAEIEELIEFYHLDPSNTKVLFMILQKDFSFIYEYDFAVNDEAQNRAVLNKINKFHINDYRCREFITTKIIQSDYEDAFIINVLDRFIQGLFFKDYLVIIEDILLKNRFELFDELRKQIQTIPYQYLTDKVSSCFILDPINFEIPLQLKSKKNDIFSATTNGCYYEIIKKNIDKKEVFTVNGDKILPLKIEKSILDEKIVLILSEVASQSISFTSIPSDGNMTYLSDGKEIGLKYSKARRTKTGNVSVVIDSVNQNSPIQDNAIIYLNNLLEVKYITRATIKSHTNMCDFKFEVFKSPTTIKSCKIPNYKFDYTLFKFYHPDLLSHDLIIQKIHDDLQNDLLKNECSIFIKKLGLSYLFHKDLHEVCYGVVMNFRYGFLKIYLMEKQKFIDKFIGLDDVTDFALFDYVTLEENGSVRKLNDDNDFDMGYLESEIILINGERNEGFIYFKNKKSQMDNDYYFNFSSCNFYPKLHDKVRFLPVKNPVPNYQNQPFAIKISHISLPVCLITECNFELDKIFGKARNTQTDEILHFSLNQIVLFNLTKNTQLKIGDKFEYSTIRLDEIRKTHLIKFVNKIL